MSAPAPTRARKVRCPQCGKMAEYSEANLWRPFCSERCRKIDLGAWANEEYRVPASSSGGSVDALQDELP